MDHNYVNEDKGMPYSGLTLQFSMLGGQKCFWTKTTNNQPWYKYKLHFM